MHRCPLGEVGRGLGERGDRPHADVFGVEDLQPLGESAGREDRRELGGERLLVGVELALHQLGPAEQLRQAAEEGGLERGDRQVAAVGGLVDAVARQAAGQHARDVLAAQPVRDEAVRPVRQRDDDVAALAGALTLQQRREDLLHGAERARREVGDRDRRQPGSRVPEAPDQPR